MEKLIHRQNMTTTTTTLDYLPPSEVLFSEEMDFNDVFGGPPRRFSMQELRVSPETVQSEDGRFLSPWNSEKPVFGEESSNSSGPNISMVRRRRQQLHHSRDFYDDIFRGDDSSYKSPRRIDRDSDNAFGSTSPSMPSPSSSLPLRLTNKGEEFPTFGSSHNQNSSSLSRFSINQANQSSPLSHQSSMGCCSSTEDSPSSPYDHRSGNIEDGNKNSEEQFHFSIYKWAGRDVPVLIPLSSNKSRKNKAKVDSFSQEMIHEAVATETMKVLDGTDIVKEEEEDSSASIKSRAKSLRAFLTDDVENSGNAAKVKESKARAFKLYVENAKNVETDPESEENADKKSGVMGRIRDFVQKFNQEGDSSIKSDDVHMGSRRYRWKLQQKENKANVDISKAGEKSSSEKREKDQKDVDFKVEDKDEAEQCTDTKAPSYRTSHSPTNQNEFSSDPSRGNSKISMDDPLDCSFLVQELSDDHQQNTRNDGEISEDIRALDAKIHQWSVGKKGNIRSLLSTLQYVLWQGSGWQPIALVDLIESNSVRRAYQKALLRLHPDKLQQKGAATDHKYIAQKVFDILQEAWDHFNTLGL